MITRYDMFSHNLENVAYDDGIAGDYFGDHYDDYYVDHLLEFTDEDWKQLLAELPNKSIMWKKRLCQCLWEPDPQNPPSLCIEAWLSMANAEDIELFCWIVESLLGMNAFNVEELKPIYVKAKKTLPTAEKGFKKVLSEFVNKYETAQSQSRGQ